MDLPNVETPPIKLPAALRVLLGGDDADKLFAAAIDIGRAVGAWFAGFQMHNSGVAAMLRESGHQRLAVVRQLVRVEAALLRAAGDASGVELSLLADDPELWSEASKTPRDLFTSLTTAPRGSKKKVAKKKVGRPRGKRGSKKKVAKKKVGRPRGK